jgi:hypothetical protein
LEIALQADTANRRPTTTNKALAMVRDEILLRLLKKTRMRPLEQKSIKMETKGQLVDIPRFV